MSKKHQQIKIYDLDYLINEEYTEEDLHYLLDTKSFRYSLIVGMFRFIGENNRTDNDIINICKTNDKWFDKYHWKNPNQRKQFIGKVAKIYKNLYQYSESKSYQLAEWWMLYNGFSIKGNYICE